MQNQKIHRTRGVLLSTFPIPKAKKLVSQTGAKMRPIQIAFWEPCDNMPGDLLISYFIWQRPHCRSGVVGSHGVRKQLPCLQAALSELQEAAPLSLADPPLPAVGV